MLLTKNIEITPFSKASYYESLGYVLPKYKIGSHKKLMVPRDFKLEVNIEHLSKTSNYKIEYCCDKCKLNFITSYYNYNRSNKTKGDFCRKCSMEVYNSGENNSNFGKRLECGFKNGELNYASIHFKGSNNPNYNPNLTDEERTKNRDLVENINWRISVFKRDNFKCVICEDNKIEAHHLNSYSRFKEQRFDINNGVTLCINCHKSYHKTKGYINATKEKYEEYIKEIRNVLFN